MFDSSTAAKLSSAELAEQSKTDKADSLSRAAEQRKKKEEKEKKETEAHEAQQRGIESLLDLVKRLAEPELAAPVRVTCCGWFRVSICSLCYVVFCV